MTAYWNVKYLRNGGSPPIMAAYWNVNVHGTGHDRGLNELLQEVTRSSVIQIIKTSRTYIMDASGLYSHNIIATCI